MPGHVLGGREGLLDRHRILGLRGAVVVHEHHGGVGSDRDLAGHAVVRLLVAQDPAAAVEVHHHWQGSLGPFGPDDADADRAGGTDRERGVLDRRRKLGDGLGLCAGQHVAGGIRAHGVDRRAARSGQAVDELLGLGLEHGGRLGSGSRHTQVSGVGSPLVRCRTDSPCTAERGGANGYTVRAIRWLEGPCSWLRLICLRPVSTELVPGTILRATPAAGSEGDRSAERHQRSHKCRKI